jgi:ankyrin repeat protein
MTALMMAAREGHADIVQMLIDADADVSLRTNEDSSRGDYNWVCVLLTWDNTVTHV